MHGFPAKPPGVLVPELPASWPGRRRPRRPLHGPPQDVCLGLPSERPPDSQDICATLQGLSPIPGQPARKVTAPLAVRAPQQVDQGGIRWGEAAVEVKI